MNITHNVTVQKIISEKSSNQNTIGHEYQVELLIETKNRNSVKGYPLNLTMDAK